MQRVTFTLETSNWHQLKEHHILTFLKHLVPDALSYFKISLALKGFCVDMPHYQTAAKIINRIKSGQFTETCFFQRGKMTVDLTHVTYPRPRIIKRLESAPKNNETLHVSPQFVSLLDAYRRQVGEHTISYYIVTNPEQIGSKGYVKFQETHETEPSECIKQLF